MDAAAAHSCGTTACSRCGGRAYRDSEDPIAQQLLHVPSLVDGVSSLVGRRRTTINGRPTDSSLRGTPLPSLAMLAAGGPQRCDPAPPRGRSCVGAANIASAAAREWDLP